MEQNQKEFKNGHPEGCRCMMCHGTGMMCGNGMQSGCHGRKFCFLRFILILAIISFVFWSGVKVGEFKSEFKSGFYGSNGSSRYMMIRGNDGGLYYGPQMMSGWYQQSATTSK